MILGVVIQVSSVYGHHATAQFIIGYTNAPKAITYAHVRNIFQLTLRL